MNSIRIALATLQGVALCAILGLPAAARMSEASDVLAARACAALIAGAPATSQLLASAALSSNRRLREAALSGSQVQTRVTCVFAYPDPL